MAGPAPSRRDSKEDQECCWYHGRISREVAEDRLRFGEKNPTDGRFLVRDFYVEGETSEKCDYVLSMTCGGDVIHYVIRQLGDDAFYSIDEGPVIHGLDALIELYQINQGGLPCPLLFRLPGKPPPAETRRHGRTNLLHRSTKEGNLEIIREVIQSGYHNLDAKNQEGQTVLHLAVINGHVEALKLLLSSGSTPNIVDTKGYSPLHYACRHSQTEMARILLDEGADPRLRSTYEKIVALHEAAEAGSIQCCEALLARGCPKRPRTREEILPEELAEKAGYPECAVLIRKATPVWSSDFPPRDRWFHPTLTARQDTQAIFESTLLKPGQDELMSDEDGAFLIRKSARLPSDWYVLSLCYEGHVRNFEIRRTDVAEGDRHAGGFLYIDDGPLFESLEELVNHHMTWTDGLYCLLSRPVAPKAFVPAPVPPAEVALEECYEMLKDFQTTPTPETTPVRVPRSHEKTPLSSKENKPEKPQRKNLRRSPPPVPPLPVSSPASVAAVTEGVSALDVNDNHRPAIPKRAPSFNLPRFDSAPTGSVGIVGEDGPSLPRVGAVQEGSLTLGEVIGSGQFGSVHSGRWRAPNGAEYDVAVKILHVHDNEGNRIGRTEADFLKEAKVMLSLEDHAHVVKIAGICRGSKLMMVTELAPLGALYDFLINSRERITTEHFRVWAAQVAKGMCFLEENRYVHRDLACRNLLLKNDLLVKISDFGLSRALGVNDDVYRASGGGEWPVKWYAPESVCYGDFTVASDVWSFGIVLWEMYSYGATPYGDLTGSEVSDMIEKGERLRRPIGCPSDVYQVMEKCWAYKPEDRPSFARLDRYFSTERYQNLPASTLLRNRAKLAKSARKDSTVNVRVDQSPGKDE